jgi:hypothetical protein
MKPAKSVIRLLACLLLSGATTVASADVIDSFTAPQGPMTVGPGEEPSEEEAVVFTPSVLGGFRVAAPGVDDNAQPGSTATVVIAGGSLECAVDFPSLGSPDNYGGCATGYDRGAGPVFDLTGSSQIQFDVLSVEGGMSMGVTLVDANEELSVGLIPNVTAGQLSIRFDEMIPVTFPFGADLSLIDNIGLAIVNQEDQEGRVVLGEFSTDGPIADGPILPVDDVIEAEEIPGTYYNTDRDGEGCQLTLERDQTTFILTCYFYYQGEQFWVIGVGELVGGEIVFGELTITSGAQYGDDFVPGDVVRTPWGLADMTWSDCNNAFLQLTPLLPGYEQVTLDLTRIVPTTCGGGGVPGDFISWMGAFFDPNRDGEGFHFGVEVGGVFVMTWYTYLNGKQIWLIGTGVREGDGPRVVFDNMIITHGADFGSEFDPADVVRETFGEIIVDFTDCNNFKAAVNPVLPQFHALELDVTKIVPGACP